MISIHNEDLNDPSPLSPQESSCAWHAPGKNLRETLKQKPAEPQNSEQHSRKPTQSTTVPAAQPTPKPQAKDNCPQILLLGNSHTNNIHESGICLEADTLKMITYTVEEANRFVLQNEINSINAVILHLVTNDVKSVEVETVVDNITKLVELIETKANKPKVILSLSPMRNDCNKLQEKCIQVNNLLTLYAQLKDNIRVCPHINWTSENARMTITHKPIYWRQTSPYSFCIFGYNPQNISGEEGVNSPLHWS